MSTGVNLGVLLENQVALELKFLLFDLVGVE